MAEEVHYQEPWERHTWCGQDGPTSADTSEVTCKECSAIVLAAEEALALHRDHFSC